nr:hypoxanthine phosphoribosyltransferase [Magnetofaba australis]
MITEEQLQERVAVMARQVVDLVGPQPILVSLLKGAFMFTADLLRELGRIGAKPHLDFMRVSSYGSGTVSSGQVEVLLDIKEDIRGKSVVVVDDILDTGNTLKAVSDLLKSKGASQVRSCMLLDKPARRTADVTPDIVGFEIPDAFVVGYGIDWDNRFRELPYVGVVKE